MLTTILAILSEVLKLINKYIDDKNSQATILNKQVDVEVTDAKNKLEALSGTTAGLMDSLQRLRQALKD